jgi:hypothetical protein
MAAGGSTSVSEWGISPEPRIMALMGMAIGAPAANANISNITQPTLLIAGSLDSTSPPSVSKAAFELLATDEDEKVYVEIGNAMHRTFDSTYCRQMQSSAAIAQANPGALLDFHTASRILKIPPGGNPSGVGMDYCGYEDFRSPIDITPIVETLTAVPTATPPVAGFVVTETNVPTTGLTIAQLRPCISELAITFFEHALDRHHSRWQWHHFRDDFPIGWLSGHHSNRSRGDEDREADEPCHGLIAAATGVQ